MNRKAKYIIIILMILGSFGMVFAFWASNVNAPDDETADGNVNVGVGRAVDTLINVNSPTSNQTLVPIGTSHIAQGTNLVEQIDLNFNVTWTETAGLGATAGEVIERYLVASFVENSISLDPTVHHLVNINYTRTHQIILEGAAVVVVVSVTLDRPINHTQYLLLASQLFTFRMNFSVVETPLTIDEQFDLAINYLTDNYASTSGFDANPVGATNTFFFYEDGINLPTSLNLPGNPTVNWHHNGAFPLPQNFLREMRFYTPSITIAGVTREVLNANFSTISTDSSWSLHDEAFEVEITRTSLIFYRDGMSIANYNDTTAVLVIQYFPNGGGYNPVMRIYDNSNGWLIAIANPNVNAQGIMGLYYVNHGSCLFNPNNLWWN